MSGRMLLAGGKRRTENINLESFFPEETIKEIQNKKVNQYERLKKIRAIMLGDGDRSSRIPSPSEDEDQFKLKIPIINT
jgi:hypothetical protein